MREIKFRAWYKTDKKMLYEGCLLGKDPEDNHYLSINFNGNIEVAVNDDGGKSGLWEHSCSGWGEDFILMQYTGLKDKNGKEIYEGDVVSIKSRYKADGSIDTKAKVKFFNGSFRLDFYAMILNRAVLEYTKSNWIIEVIGNIYENPEWLEKGVER